MRIIGGKLKGRQLVSFQAKHIRPTTDRVKESIFNKLMSDIPEARVLDLFAGTGNLSIEAFSRGASYVESVELSKKSLKILSENLKKLEIEQEVVVRSADVFKYLRSYESEPFDVIFIDPPFTEKLAHRVMESVSQSSVLKDHSIVVIESSSQERIDDQYPGLLLLDRKGFGDKAVSFFEKARRS